MHRYESRLYDQIKERLIETYGYSELMELMVFENELGKNEFYIKDCINGEVKTLSVVDSQLIFNIEIACLLDLKNEILSCGR